MNFSFDLKKQTYFSNSSLSMVLCKYVYIVLLYEIVVLNYIS